MHMKCEVGINAYWTQTEGGRTHYHKVLNIHGVSEGSNLHHLLHTQKSHETLHIGNIGNWPPFSDTHSIATYQTYNQDCMSPLRQMSELTPSICGLLVSWFIFSSIATLSAEKTDGSGMVATTGTVQSECQAMETYLHASFLSIPPHLFLSAFCVCWADSIQYMIRIREPALQAGLPGSPSSMPLEVEHRCSNTLPALPDCYCCSPSLVWAVHETWQSGSSS